MKKIQVLLFILLLTVSMQAQTTVTCEAHIVAEKEERDAPNEIKAEETGSIVGSAPVIVNLYGSSESSATIYYTWFIYNKKDLQNPIARYTDKNIYRYSFDQTGDFLVVLETADLNSTCVDTTSVSVKVTESYLDAPNYFSPDDTPGVNDEFRVAYKSLIKFKCTIFNRWGTKLYQWTDPAKGWDGKHNGKYVNTGVYFYVIEAEGSDGVKYKKGGDINILRKR
jgi:gliding motility-associated-like protein